MRRIGLAFWLLRVALPAIATHWSGRVLHALRHQTGGADARHRAGEPVAALLEALRWSTVVSMLLTLLILVEVLRLVSRW